MTDHVRTLETQAALHERNDLIEVTIALVERQKRGELLGVDLVCQLETLMCDIHLSWVLW